MGARREAVARFSFFMVIIPILGQALLDTVKLLQGDTAADSSFEVYRMGTDDYRLHRRTPRGMRSLQMDA